MPSRNSNSCSLLEFIVGAAPGGPSSGTRCARRARRAEFSGPKTTCWHAAAGCHRRPRTSPAEEHLILERFLLVFGALLCGAAMMPALLAARGGLIVLANPPVLLHRCIRSQAFPADDARRGLAPRAAAPQPAALRGGAALAGFLSAHFPCSASSPSCVRREGGGACTLVGSRSRPEAANHSLYYNGPPKRSVIRRLAGNLPAAAPLGRPELAPARQAVRAYCAVCLWLILRNANARGSSYLFKGPTDI